MRLRPPLLLLASLCRVPAVFGGGPPGYTPPRYTPRQAAAHVGEDAQVCGVVSSATHLVASRGQPTLLNLDRPWPRHIFTVVIWNDARPRFLTAPDVEYLYQRVCATGRIRSYEGIPQIQVDDPASLGLERDVEAATRPPDDAPSLLILDDPSLPEAEGPRVTAPPPQVPPPQDPMEIEVDVALPPAWLDLSDQ